MRGQLFEISPAEAKSDFVKGFMFERSQCRGGRSSAGFVV
jgi:hypothetical protein